MYIFLNKREENILFLYHFYFANSFWNFCFFLWFFYYIKKSLGLLKYIKIQLNTDNFIGLNTNNFIVMRFKYFYWTIKIERLNYQLEC